MIGNFLWSYWQQILGFGSLLTLIIMAALFFAAKPAFDAIVGFFSPVLKSLGSFVGKVIDELGKTSGRLILVVLATNFALYNVGWYKGQDDLWKDIRAKYTLFLKKGYK